MGFDIEKGAREHLLRIECQNINVARQTGPG